MAFPAGIRDGVGNFIFIGENIYLWSTSAGSIDAASSGIHIFSEAQSVSCVDMPKVYGCSVRCIKD